jgi:hypothetical protein
LTHPGPFRCAQGLSCVYVNDYYSQCQKPARKRAAKFLKGKKEEKKEKKEKKV